MNRRSAYDEYEYDDNDSDQHRPRKFKKKEVEDHPEKKKWDRESLYDRDHDYDERR